MFYFESDPLSDCMTSLLQQSQGGKEMSEPEPEDADEPEAVVPPETISSLPDEVLKIINEMDEATDPAKINIPQRKVKELNEEYECF